MSKKHHLPLILAIIYTTFGVSATINSNQPMVEYYNFDDIQYVFFSQRVTWEEANMLCINFDAKLAVLNDKSKATNVAEAMAESDIAMEDAWLGARRFDSTWFWNDGNNSSSFQYAIPIEPDIDDFPPWSRKPLRANKECLAIDRKSHSLPNFVDLDCRLLRPFVCEKKSDHLMKNPIPSKWVKIKKNVYTLYHGRVTWTEAVTYCRSQGMRLAVIYNQYIVNILSNSMTNSRPDFENVWIGARYSYGQWKWLSTGSILDSKTDDTGYPPWRFGKPEKNDGCLLLDRHLEKKPSFIEMVCDGKRDFVCEKYPEGELEDWMNEPSKIDYGNVSIVIYPIEKTWDESKLYCQERGSTLTYVNNLSLANLIVTSMGDHPREVTHLWLGGLYNFNTSEWRWIYNNEVISTNKNDFGFPPWAHSVTDADTFQEDSACLNLDRVDHTEPHFYGLNCESKQAFACTIDCGTPPPVANGSWDCTDYNNTSKSCSLQCEKGFLTMGVRNVRCEFPIGWFNKLDWLEFPVCIDPINYLKRLTRSLGQDLQKTSGYYILLSHSNEKMNSLALQLTRKLLTLFPLNARRKMGMSYYVKNIRKNIPYNQNDTCSVLQLLSANDELKVEEQMNLLATLNHIEWSSDIKNHGRKTLIIAILDSITAKRNQEIFDKLRTFGHYIVIIGLNDDWELLMPLATIGYDQRLSIYLFNEEEFETAVKNFNSIKDRFSKCQEQNMSLSKYTAAKELSKVVKDSSKVFTIKPTTKKIPIPLQSKEIIQNNSDELTTINSIASEMALNVETNDSEKNQVESNELLSYIIGNPHEDDTYENPNNNDSKDMGDFDVHESTLPDNIETTEIQSTTLNTEFDS